MSTLQGLNYLLPLITLPYLVRVLGVEYFGLLAFTTAIITYFNILTEYGFNLTATKEISIHRNDKEKITEIFSAVMTIKFMLMLLSLTILSILVFSFDKFSDNWLIYFLTFGIVIGQFLFPVWFFQGMENMKYITYLNIVSKLIFTMAIFVFIQTKDDFYLVPVFTSLGLIVAGIWSLSVIRKKFGIFFKYQPTERLSYYFKKAHPMFLSYFSMTLYTSSTTVLLGFFGNNTVVGYFAAAEKIMLALNGLVGPVLQTLYPHIAKKAQASKKYTLSFIKKITIILSTFTLLLSFATFFFADTIITIILGDQYTESTLILQIMSFLPLVTALSNIFGVQTMCTFDKNKEFSQILLFSGIFHLLISIILVHFFLHIGSAIAVITTETVIAGLMFYYLQKNDLKIFEK